MIGMMMDVMMVNISRSIGALLAFVPSGPGDEACPAHPRVAYEFPLDAMLAYRGRDAK
jgi:hypothetical protein